ncbi:hypothetical protein [Saccharospirillum salsuginis]|uniref:Uncharacterized protein n=1 Tax=Saccharospirillum salsuginis TaxID=418750 RepID=A0A918KJS8_9GAMM|nr:hypothetical protein [Saccharospirillum salsuginis]GGX66135.1 hypothetical protein GCM10007392_37220 [Saccharospirillum salsuginis]
MTRNLKRTLVTGTLIISASATGAQTLVEVIDHRHDPAGSFLAYTEFELSGEPLAEALGLDLDVLDPDAVDQPTRFDYITGIESYEYSEEAMYALDYQSGMGPHLVNGPRNRDRGGEMDALGRRFTELANSVGYPVTEIPLNMYPLSWPYQLGSPEFAEPVAVSEVDRDGDAIIPAYFRDYASLRWTDSDTVKEASPAALGGLLLKEVMWSQDFLGGLHTTDTDEEVEADSADQDQRDGFALGVSSVDGLNGVILTELSLDKMHDLLTRMTYDGESLGAPIDPTYDASSPVWFPHRLAVESEERLGVESATALTVADGASYLRDSWMLLWPAAEMLAFSDQRSANESQNPAFRAVFDGKPFAATPKANRDANSDNDVFGTDAFSLANTLARMAFRNLNALHFDKGVGTLVDRWDGERGGDVTTYDLAYSLVALSVFQKAQDALPVGYAGGNTSDGGLGTQLGQEALKLIRHQADFILAHLEGENGLMRDGATVSGSSVNLEPGQSLDTQFAVLRGLGAAFSATGDRRYRDAARDLFIAIDREQYDPAIGTWASVPGTPTEHTLYTAAAISAGLRTALLQLRNVGAESAPKLEVAHLVARHNQWFRTVINGPTTNQGMQMAEWLGDSGEHRFGAAP